MISGAPIGRACFMFRIRAVASLSVGLQNLHPDGKQPIFHAYGKGL